MATTNSTTNSISIEIGSSIYTASLLNNPTATALYALLPLRLQMSELNGNEKHADLPIALPTMATNPGPIKIGDIMLYGSRTLVLWYENFTTSYTYTRVGSINDPAGLTATVGAASVSVQFARSTEGGSGIVGNGTGNSTATSSSGARVRNTHV